MVEFPAPETSPWPGSAPVSSRTSVWAFSGIILSRPAVWLPEMACFVETGALVAGEHPEVVFRTFHVCPDYEDGPDPQIDAPAASEAVLLMDAARGARTLAMVRLGVGAAGLLAPRLFARVWLGPAATEHSIVPAVRGLAGRDAALGLGVLFALRRKAPVRGWLEAGALADFADSASSAVGYPDMPGGRRLMFSTSGAAVGVLGMRLARRLEPRKR